MVSPDGPGLPLPTAAHSIELVQESASSVLLVAPVGFGEDWSVHALPFQLSARVCIVKIFSAASPTAKQDVEDRQEMLSSTVPPSFSLGLGVDCCVQLLPFQLSASVTFGLLDS